MNYQLSLAQHDIAGSDAREVYENTFNGNMTGVSFFSTHERAMDYALKIAQQMAFLMRNAVRRNYADNIRMLIVATPDDDRGNADFENVETTLITIARHILPGDSRPVIVTVKKGEAPLWVYDYK